MEFYSLTSTGRNDFLWRSGMQLGCISLLLNELLWLISTSCRGCEGSMSTGSMLDRLLVIKNSLEITKNYLKSIRKKTFWGGCQFSVYSEISACFIEFEEDDLGGFM